MLSFKVAVVTAVSFGILGMIGCATPPRPKLNEKIDKIAFYNGLSETYSKTKGLHLTVDLRNRVVEDYLQDCRKLGPISTVVDIQPGSINSPISDWHSLLLNSKSPETQDIKVGLANEAFKIQANTIVLREVVTADRGLMVVLAAKGDALSCQKVKSFYGDDVYVRAN